MKKNENYPANKLSILLQTAMALLMVASLINSSWIVWVNAAEGDLDNRFGIGGRVTDAFMVATDAAIQKDGKIVVGGAGQTQLARFNSDGTLDPAFGNGGKAAARISNLQDVAIQSDGKILVAGANFSGGQGDFGLARYNADGTPDAAFGSNGVVTTDFFGFIDQANSIAIQTDGHILIAGLARTGQLTSDFALARYNPDGSPDADFGVGGKVTTNFTSDPAENFELIDDMVIQPDGRIVVAGGSQSRSAFARYMPNGELDVSFGGDGKATLPLTTSNGSNSAALLDDGRIVAGGSVSRSGTGFDFLLLRLLSDGSLDSSFGIDGMAITDFNGKTDVGKSLVVLADGRILQVGYANNSSNDFVNRDFALIYYTADGFPDITFGDEGKIITDFFNNHDEANAVAIQSNGRAIVVGRANNEQPGFGLAAYVLDESANDSKPKIESVSIKGKKLVVVGSNFESPTEIYVDGQKQKKTFNDLDNPTTTVTAKKAGKPKFIAPGQTVTVQVKNMGTGETSSEFMFTRPL